MFSQEEKNRVKRKIDKARFIAAAQKSLEEIKEQGIDLNLNSKEQTIANEMIKNGELSSYKEWLDHWERMTPEKMSQLFDEAQKEMDKMPDTWAKGEALDNTILYQN